jgi:hypothetical protein
MRDLRNIVLGAVLVFFASVSAVGDTVNPRADNRLSNAIAQLSRNFQDLNSVSFSYTTTNLMTESTRAHRKAQKNSYVTTFRYWESGEKFRVEMANEDFRSGGINSAASLYNGSKYQNYNPPSGRLSVSSHPHPGMILLGPNPLILPVYWTVEDMGSTTVTQLRNPEFWNRILPDLSEGDDAQFDGTRLILVKRSKLVLGEKNEVLAYLDPASNYYPIRIELRRPDGTLRNLLTVENLEKILSNGNTIFVPIHTTSINYGKDGSVVDRNITELDRITLNTDIQIPDELFSIPISQTKIYEDVDQKTILFPGKAEPDGSKIAKSLPSIETLNSIKASDNIENPNNSVNRGILFASAGALAIVLGAVGCFVLFRRRINRRGV